MRFFDLWVRTLLVFGCTALLLYACKDDDMADPGGNPQPTYKQYGTPFSEIPSNDDLVVYEVNLRAFSQQGIAGVTARLDNLAALHTNVIWLMPIYPIGSINSVNSPYSVKNYKAIGAEYGTIQDLRNLTDEAHARGIAVILDWVANHTAWDNPWMSNKDWYTQDASGNIIYPAGTNWQDVADLNFNNMEMRLAMIDAMKFWALEANIDGFRCDYADGVPFSFWKQAIDTLESIPGRDYIFLAEGNRNDHYTAGFDLTYAWDFYNTMKGVFNGQAASGLFTTNTAEYQGIPTGRHKLRFTTNHDESAWDQTPISLFNGKAGALAASVVTIFLNGVPLFYTGQETGRASNVPFFSNSQINWNDNPDMLQAYQKMMTVYSEEPAARSGQTTTFPNAQVACFQRSLDGNDLLIIANLKNQAVNFALPAAIQNTSWVNTISGESLALTSTLALQSYGYFILKKS